MNLSDAVLKRFDDFPDDEPPHNALYRYNRPYRYIRRVNQLWLWVKDEETLAIVTHPKEVKQAVGEDEWTLEGEGMEKEWWTRDGHGLLLFPVNPDPARYL
ncbi:hypothetical protein [Nocardia jiangxiensis]|uniref:hypothetical protein n=1 Tax=Nocardia jiangxiensis TaxID=282685 RepID=UPI0002D442F4|nr:hypothetical protein [Nocardia jiangxiensis]